MATVTENRSGKLVVLVRWWVADKNGGGQFFYHKTFHLIATGFVKSFCVCSRLPVSLEWYIFFDEFRSMQGRTRAARMIKQRRILSRNAVKNNVSWNVFPCKLTRSKDFFQEEKDTFKLHQRAQTETLTNRGKL